MFLPRYSMYLETHWPGYFFSPAPNHTPACRCPGARNEIVSDTNLFLPRGCGGGGVAGKGVGKNDLGSDTIIFRYCPGALAGGGGGGVAPTAKMSALFPRVLISDVFIETKPKP